MHSRCRKLLFRLAWRSTLPWVWSCSLLCGQQSSAPVKDNSGQQIFSACAGCHGLDGGGGEHAPNIATNPEVRAMSDPALAAIIRNGIPAAGMPGFGKLLDENQLRAVLLYLRSLQGAGSTITSRGDATRGRELFFGRAGCAQCHMMSGAGGSFGADLSTYAQGRSADALREAILAPEKVVDPRRGPVNVTTRSGKTYSGLIRNEDNFSLQMQTPDGKFHFFDKTDLASIERDARSLTGSHGNKLSSAELDDLVNFLSHVTGGSSKPDQEEDE